jgi:serine/threonine protein kinase
MAVSRNHPSAPDDPNAGGTLRMIQCCGCGAACFVAPGLPPLTSLQCSRCRQELLVPLRLREFELRAPIASGGIGTVYRATDTVLKRDVAVKLLRPEFAADRRKVEEFHAEARAIAALNHPHIIQIFYFGEAEGQNFIAMELAANGSLEEFIVRDGRLDEVAVLDVGIKIAGALAAAHRAGLLHRDIKPANILFNAAGEPKLIDFGLARSADTRGEWGAEIWATPEYASPETIRRAAEGFHADMYSLGCTLSHALTGRVPFPGATVREKLDGHLNLAPTAPRQFVPGISAATNAALLRMLAKQPAERFASYDELVMAFTAARSHLLVQHVSRSPAKGVPRLRSAATPGRRRAALAGMGATVVALLGAAAWFLVHPRLDFIAAKPATGESQIAPSTASSNAPPPPTLTAFAPDPEAVARLAGQPKPAPQKVSRPGMTGPWVALTDDKAVGFWRGLTGGKAFPAGTWKLQSGFLSVIGTNRTPLVLKEKFVDFELTFEWRAAPETRATLIFGAPETTDRRNPAAGALRVPLGDDTAAGATTGNPRNTTAALAGVLAPGKAKTLKPLGQFNQVRLVAFTNHVELWLNGAKVNDFVLGSERFKEAVARSPLKNRADFGHSTAGFVGFLPSPGFTVRNARIRAIAEPPAPPATPQVATQAAPSPVKAGKKKKGR